MKPLSIKIIFSVLLLVINAAYANNLLYTTKQDLAKIQFYAEDYPPYNYPSKGKIVGYSIDLLSELYSRNSLNTPKIKLTTDLNTHIQDIKKQNALLSVHKTSKTSSSFQWVGPIIDTPINIYCSKNLNIRIKNLDQLIELSYAVQKNEIDHFLLRKEWVPSSQIKFVDTIDEAIDLVTAGKVDCFIEEKHVINWLISKKAIKSSEFKKIYTLHQGEIYFAFNKAVNQKSVELFREMFYKLTSDKEFMKKLAKKYDLPRQFGTLVNPKIGVI